MTEELDEHGNLKPPVSFYNNPKDQIKQILVEYLTASGSAFAITEEGEQSLEPTSQEGWDEVIFGAQVIIESSYLLTKPDRSKGRKDWIIFSEMLEPIGRNALEAAEKKDAESLFQIGADLYQACVACHNVYMPK